MIPSLQNAVILVDENDREIGTMEKIEAHRSGALHRAFSVFLFNASGEMLIHRRSAQKYHCAGEWSNACCSHPLPGVDIADCVSSRLRYEMGIEANLFKAFEFKYRAELDNGLIEHEYDHIYTGRYDGIPDPNSAEADAWRYVSAPALRSEMAETPDAFTPWFRMLFEKVVHHHAATDRSFQQF